MCNPSTWATVCVGTYITLELLNFWLSLQETALPFTSCDPGSGGATCLFLNLCAVLSTEGWPPQENKLFWWDSLNYNANLYGSPAIAPGPQPPFNTIQDPKGSLNLCFTEIHIVYAQRQNSNSYHFQTKLDPFLCPLAKVYFSGPPPKRSSTKQML